MSSTALGAEKAIIFISDAHEKFYYEKLKEVRYQETSIPLQRVRQGRLGSIFRAWKPTLRKNVPPCRRKPQNRHRRKNGRL